MVKNNFETQAPTRIIVNTATRRLHFYHRNRFYKTYPVGVGKPNTPTPTGDYKIVYKLVNPGGVFGSRWMGLNIPGGNYGIHGTNNPASIGHYVSLGCIRMYNRDIEEIFPFTPISTPVKIVFYPGGINTSNGQSDTQNTANKNQSPPGDENQSVPGKEYNTINSNTEISSSKNNTINENTTASSTNNTGTPNNSPATVPDTIYTVRPGDTLWAISQRFNVPLEKLVQANNIANSDLIYPGQKIIIPQ